ncbi:hypothetical protein [Paenibacillus sp. XY044]|uniref:hypothetical protein n=1 Tax=Paenibacillus sp. XY044 TaxID=2026089 RepID=UPI000B99B7F3|nr:hypothetical protein [Paenibacillus sp. XY044]OZB98041.1 hypothetical protein CJP46_02425 [Paenibacillus sp. XY044]
MSNVAWIQLPRSIIKDPRLSSLEFCILARFKFLQFASSGMGKFEIDLNELKRSLEVNDNRTLKKALDNLYQYKYISKQVTFNRGRPVEVILDLDKMNLNNDFTQLPLKLFSKVGEIGHHGFRLLYYYESYVNRNKDHKQFCFAALETIENETGISRKTIVKYNKILVKAKLLQIDRHELETDYQYDEAGELIFNKYNNHYEVRLEKLL